MDMIRIFYGTKLVVAVIVLVVEIGAENNLFLLSLAKIFDEGKYHQTIKLKKLRHEEKWGLKHLFDQFWSVCTSTRPISFRAEKIKMSRYGGEEIELSDPDNSHNQRPAAPKLRGYLYVKHNPTSKKSRVRILSKVRNYLFRILYSSLQYGFIQD